MSQPSESRQSSETGQSSKSTPNRLREGAQKVAQKLRTAGFQSYFAGGSVRDRLLGLRPKDYDIVTDAEPSEVLQLFPKAHWVGQAFGVVRVRMGRGLAYEVATMRVDGSYADGRRPDSVVYSKDPKEDVRRRDFTINALLEDPETEAVHDWVGGLPDLKEKQIRAVGDPFVRFKEDRLRMLRAIRFAARFGFEIESHTFEAIQAYAGDLMTVSPERIWHELEGLWMAQNLALGARLWVQSGLLGAILKALSPADAAFFVAAMDRLVVPKGPDLPDKAPLFLAYALLFLHQPEACEASLWALRPPKAELRAILALIQAYHALSTEDGPKSPTGLGHAAGREAPLLLALIEAAEGPESALAQAFCGQIADFAAHPLPPRPMLGGQDLMEAGLKPGPVFQALLSEVDARVLTRSLKTREAALLWLQARIKDLRL